MFDKFQNLTLFEFEFKSFKNKKNKFLFQKFRKLKVIYQINPNYKGNSIMIITKPFEQVLCVECFDQSFIIFKNEKK